MSIYRVVKNRENPYVMLNKTFLSDDRLSWKAKGLLAYLLSKPDDWRVMEADLIKQSTDGRDSVRNAVKELIACGYVVRERERRADGTLGSAEYEVYELPIDPPTGDDDGDNSPRTGNPSLDDNPSPKTENPTLDNPTLDEPTLAKRPLLNNDVTNKRSRQNNEYTKGTRKRDLDKLIPTKTKQHSATNSTSSTQPSRDPRYSAFYALYPDA